MHTKSVLLVLAGILSLITCQPNFRMFFPSPDLLNRFAGYSDDIYSTNPYSRYVDPEPTYNPQPQQQQTPSSQERKEATQLNNFKAGSRQQHPSQQQQQQPIQQQQQQQPADQRVGSNERQFTSPNIPQYAQPSNNYPEGRPGFIRNPSSLDSSNGDKVPVVYFVLPAQQPQSPDRRTSGSSQANQNVSPYVQPTNNYPNGNNGLNTNNPNPPQNSNRRPPPSANSQNQNPNSNSAEYYTQQRPQVSRPQINNQGPSGSGEQQQQQPYTPLSIQPQSPQINYNQQIPNNNYNRPPQPSNNQNNFQQQPEREEKFADYKPVTNFAWNLFKASNSFDTPNLIMCPLSPQLLLGYLSKGSTGETQSEIKQAIQYSGPSQMEHLIRTMLANGGNRELQFATAFFVGNKFLLDPSFITNDNVEIIPTDFSHPQRFSHAYNQWVNAKTKGSLPLVNFKPDPSTQMIMSSAVYFKGGWIYKFNPANEGEFFTNQGRRMVPMMKLQKKLPHGTINDMAEWISIPYNSSSDCMVIILPKNGNRIDDLVARLDKSHVNKIMESLNADNYANVNLTMPKFKIDSTMSLAKPMQDLGIKKAFNHEAELTRLTRNSQPLRISNAVQQASLEVNEEGSIASSVTNFHVVALSYSPPVPDIEFLVNRPFIALIADRERQFPYFVAKIGAP